ncbi:sensor histidine kinase [Desulfobacula phenolica]|uniref:histidine kinase n=1 Tax=Desulfobacula phenolica TaxID=90732 RepID=A0A1H2HSW9_9BACT|nr:ATP-binding protein [Desulfobacula phenolica]SDU35000.1 two-component system, NtrC family, sensor histidine kinase AtoS [Desulfobacula phenolica]
MTEYNQQKELYPVEQNHGAPSRKKQTLKKKRFVSLRYRFILITSIMLLVLLGTLAAVLAVLQTRTIRGRIEKQGMAIAKNLAAISIDHLVTYNYVALEKLANQAVNNPEIIYVIVHDKEGKVAGYSRRPDLQNRYMADDISRNAIAATIPLISVRGTESGTTPVMDVAVPVYISNDQDRWGTIRVCLSLDLMYQQIRQTLWSILIVGSVALAIGILISNWAAQRVTRPLGTLVNATVEAAQGNLDQKLSIRTRDEVEILADNFSVMIREILAHKQQLEHQINEIKQLQQYAEKILATMTDGLLAVDMKGIVTAVNPAAHAILSIPLDHAAKDRHVLKLFDKNNPFAAYIQDSLENPSARNQREIHLQNGKETRIILAGAGVLQSDKKMPRQIIFNINDITDLKQLEAEIRQNQRLADLGTLAAGMAHEIRNPLSAIKTYVALLPKKIEKPGFLEKFQRTVPREINRLNTLTEELLELSRPPKYNFNQTDISQLLRQCIELLEADFTDRGIDCQSDFAHDLPQIMADADQLEKVFINLMQNGAQAMQDGGIMIIHASFKDNLLAIDFRDTGHGFSSELAENIFNPFFTTKAKGTGLGLAITHKVISEHGGQIKAKSQQGKGCCFSISLPRGTH